MDYKINLDILVPVVLTNATTGLAHAGVAFGSVSVTVLRSDGSNASYIPTSPQWTEVTAGVFSGQGYYDLVVPAADTNLPGVLQYGVSVAADDLYFGVVNLVANLEAETFTRIGNPAGASVSADVAAVKAELVTVDTNAATAATQAAIAATQASSANSNALAASTNTIAILADVGNSFLSGTLSADVSATYHLAAAGGGGGGSGTVNLSSVLNILGTPVVSVSRDIYEVARLVKHPALQSKK